MDKIDISELERVDFMDANGISKIIIDKAPYKCAVIDRDNKVIGSIVTINVDVSSDNLVVPKITLGVIHHPIELIVEDESVIEIQETAIDRKGRRWILEETAKTEKLKEKRSE